MKKIFYLICLLFIFISCAGEKVNENKSDTNIVAEKTPLIDTLNWLIGTWENANENGIMTERWEKVNDHTMNGYVTATYLAGESSDLNLIDTLEIIKIEEQFGKLKYIPAVRNQNQGLPISFTMTSMNDSVFVFENPEHDFPTKIVYRRIGVDSLQATVSGMFEGKFVEDHFNMKKK
ncbi:MAG: hypothetical protein IPM74_06345 [Crocinitomicaceae bacterium]|nr:hypothetical protein [Crocinitomicaceae bacterium]MBK8925525.1 hypothetical protein [Crocinitomicaceae bacterium]